MRYKPENKPYRIQTQEQLDNLTEFWADKLGLQGWDIRTALVPALGENMGECHFVYSQKRAHVLLVEFDAYNARPDKLYEYDQEITLVHELLHPIMAPFTPTDDDSIESVMLESVIEQMARALVATKRHYERPILVGPTVESYYDAKHGCMAIRTLTSIGGHK